MEGGQPTIRAGANGAVGVGVRVGFVDSDIDKGERNDAGDVEVEDATRTRSAPVGRGLGRAGRGASEGVEGGDEREGDSMEFDDEAAGSDTVVDVERTADSERVWRGQRGVRE
ncbi:hypothetical protein PQX77_015210 [Marasmius sp. AFHP31]|nr:hypothetical protein PQX77_015210 [Marasmius sp. AFHP31]